MKRFNLAIILLITAVSAFAQNAAQLPAQSGANSGVIRELSGEVEFKHPGASSFTAAAVGDTVASNAIISTGFRSMAVIVVGSSVITVRPLTRLSLAEIQNENNKENVNVNLQTGRVKVEVKPPAGIKTNLKVQSPSTTASVRGTEFEMDSDNVAGISGKVMVSGTGPGVIVFGGNSTTVDADGRPADPAQVAAASTQPDSPVGTSGSEALSQPAEITSSSSSLDVYVKY